MKISIITVVYNGEAFLKDCIESVINQNYKNV
jgi:glycosyltransferase involved in cell wall biosynthesis